MMTNRKLASKQVQYFNLIYSLQGLFKSYRRSYTQLQALVNPNFLPRLFCIYLEPLFLTNGLSAALTDVCIKQTAEHLAHSNTKLNTAEQNTLHRRSMYTDGKLPASVLLNQRCNANEDIVTAEASAREKNSFHNPPEKSLRAAEPPMPVLRVQRIELQKRPDSKKIISFHNYQNKISTSVAKQVSSSQKAELHLHQKDSQKRRPEFQIQTVMAAEESFKIPLRQSSLPRAIRLRIGFQKALMNRMENTVTRKISRKEFESMVNNHQNKVKQTLPVQTPSANSSEKTSSRKFHSTAARFNKHDDMVAYAPFIQSFVTLLAYSLNEENIRPAYRGSQSSPLYHSTLGTGIKTADIATQWNSRSPRNDDAAAIDRRSVWQKNISRHKGEWIKNTYNTFNVSIGADAISSQELARLDLKDELQRILIDEVRRMGIDV